VTTRPTTDFQIGHNSKRLRNVAYSITMQREADLSKWVRATRSVSIEGS